MAPKKPEPKKQPEPPKKPEKEPQKEEEDDDNTSPAHVAVEMLSNLNVTVRNRAYALLQLQKEFEGIQGEYLQEMGELEKKYHDICVPSYDKRKRYITGEEEPPREEIEAGSKIMEVVDVEDEEAEKKEPQEKKVDSGAAKGIPEFWLRALQNHTEVRELIQDHDADALKHLYDISVDLNEKANEGFTLKFHFSENEFFTNTVLTKSYKLVSEDAQILMDEATGCAIEWKQGKNLTVQSKKKKQRKGKQTRTITVEVPRESFFRFFSPPKEGAEGEDDDDEEEDDASLDDKIELDYELGTAIKEQIIPRAVDWYTGKAIPQMKFQFYDDDEEGEEEEEDEEDDAPAKQKKISNKPHGKGGDQQQCPQQ